MDIRPEPNSRHPRPSMLLSLCLSASDKRHDLEAMGGDAGAPGGGGGVTVWKTGI